MNTLPPTDRLSSGTTVKALECQYPSGLLGLPLDQVRLSWRVTSTDATRQVGYQLAWRGPSDSGQWRTIEPVAGEESIGVVAPGGPLMARERREYRVRVATAAGWSEWGAPLKLEGGLAAEDWHAQLVSIPSEFQGPTPLLRSEFELSADVASARLYGSAYGFYETWINGRRSDDEVMNPGWTPYQHRVLVQCWDVTESLRQGRNAIGVRLADGWYRGQLGGQEKHDLWGSRLAALIQLEISLVDGSRVTIVSDQTWRGGFGQVVGTSIYHGTTADLRLTGGEFSEPGFDDSAWLAVDVLPTPLERFEPRSAPGVRVIAEFAMDRTDLPDRVVLDSGQNLAGWVRLRVRGKPGDTVTIRHAEVLNPDGTLHTRSLRHAKPVDHYILGRDGECTLEPVHTYHGFRFCDVVGEATVLEAVAVAISCDLPLRSSFSCSHSGLNRFHANALWSQRSNFMSVPSDCPQRDERLGWTGDAAAFAAAANTLVDVESFWGQWLRDLTLEQRADGSLPSTVPNVFELGDLVMNDVIADPWGRSGWADAVTLIPTAVYESYGDPAVLRDNVGAMRRWVECLRSRAGSDTLIPDEPFQWGDWLDPDAPGGRPWESKVTPQFVANAFYARSAHLLAATARVLGELGAARSYADLGDRVAAAAWDRWQSDAYATQTGGALALEYNIVPSGEREAVADALAQTVREVDGRIGTGFVGARLILFALARNGHLAEAYQMLLRHEPPSWLYQVDRGATTVWERWDAIKPDGSIHTGSMDTVDDDVMVSFNHYAYGAMVDWLYRFVAGLEPTWKAPGYREVVVRPHPARELTWAKATIDTRLGSLAIDWRVDESGDLIVDLDVPFGARARLDLPLTAASRVTVDGEEAPSVLWCGRHRLVVTDPAFG